MREKKKPSVVSSPHATIAQLAKDWMVNARTIDRWKARGAPLHSEQEMVKWIPTQPRVPAACLARVAELAGDEPKGNNWAEFEKHMKAQAQDDPKTALSALARARDFASFKFEESAKDDNRGDMKFFSDLLAKFEGVVHDAQLRAKKLGVDEGDLFPRKEAERIARVIVYWLMRSVDEIEAEICPKLAAASAGGPLHREDVRKIVESPMLEFRVLQPFARAAQVEAGTTLPAWFIDAMREAMRWTLKDGAASFDQIVAGQKAA